ncbi:hypothetical protein P7K49_023282 [Saguinus oedipus]|uniref:Uncharacterized protein n=1 Tax=Saguinus oedipus TaxID=9490 RepID=A0ABQ9UL59_SAGOE|nr:hypothetical protein P7K49_023282 [Saguinus oedipus]
MRDPARPACWEPAQGRPSLCAVPAPPPSRASAYSLAAFSSASLTPGLVTGYEGSAPHPSRPRPRARQADLRLRFAAPVVTRAAAAQAGSWSCPGPRPGPGRPSPAAFVSDSSIRISHLPVPHSSGANILAESRRPRARQAGEKERRGGPWRLAGCDLSHVRGGRGRNRVLTARPLPSAASGLRLSGAARRPLPRLQLDASRSPQGKKLGGRRRGAFKRPSAAFLLPAPCAAPSEADSAAFLSERAAEGVLVTGAAFAPRVHSPARCPLLPDPAHSPLSCTR